MSLSELKGAVLAYSARNPLFSVLLPFSKLLVLIYSVYLLLNNILFLSPITSVITWISPLLYIAYIIGLVLCFAKNEMLIISIAFWLRAIDDLLFIIQYTVNVNSIVGIILYAALGWLTFKTTYINNNQ